MPVILSLRLSYELCLYCLMMLLPAYHSSLFLLHFNVKISAPQHRPRFFYILKLPSKWKNCAHNDTFFSM